MKTKLIFLASILTLNTQCTTTSTGAKVFDAAEAVTVINFTVPYAVRLGIAKDPGATKYLSAVAVTIDTFATGTALTPAAFEASLDSVDASLLRSDAARTVVTAVTTMYTTFYLKVVEQKLDQENLTTVLQTLSADIKKGIN